MAPYRFGPFTRVTGINFQSSPDVAVVQVTFDRPYTPIYSNASDNTGAVSPSIGNITVGGVVVLAGSLPFMDSIPGGLPAFLPEAQNPDNQQVFGPGATAPAYGVAPYTQAIINNDFGWTTGPGEQQNTQVPDISFFGRGYFFLNLHLLKKKYGPHVLSFDVTWAATNLDQLRTWVEVIGSFPGWTFSDLTHLGGIDPTAAASIPGFPAVANMASWNFSFVRPGAGNSATACTLGLRTTVDMSNTNYKIATVPISLRGDMTTGGSGGKGPD